METERDYRATMNLPRTDFPMRADLARREPEWSEFWDRIDVYRRSLEVNEDGPVFILHDGPPYANGHIHMGTAFNKVFKDLIVKYKTMRGFWSPYVPGWDCHGQPIEHQVEKELGPERMRTVSQAELRKLCREYALRFVDVQAGEFRRLGVRGDFEQPYLTLDPAYEAGNVRVFAEMHRRGMVYRGRKPIHWCVRCKTALAEAEIEYSDEKSDSIYVRFRLAEVPSAWSGAGKPASVLIWTTTPWTLPANVAVTLAEHAEYVGIDIGDENVIVAEPLAERVAEVAGWEDRPLVADLDGSPLRVRGGQLAGGRYAHPIHDGAEGMIITGEHVDLSTGTGAVHTAPGHGEEDYLVGARHGLPMPMPVDSDGVFDEGGGPFAGLKVDDANPRIVEYLRDRGLLAAAGVTTHSYPHCWRCKRPVIFRATEQWFVAMDRAAESTRPLREAALAAIESVEWIPGWSVNRISSMVTDRPDWCVSRQRAWGVPIPVFACAGCGESVVTEETFAAVEKLFAVEGADAWFTRDPAEYLPEGITCPACGSSELVPERDILDVWFESGVSHTSVLDAREELRRPAELYLEGSDQHRGWFQSALLTSVGAFDSAPFKSVLTHGFIVDGDGRKMSKSLGNVISPLDVVARSGADIIRLWAVSADYSQDISVSDEILERTSEAYRRIRNTFRFLLGNLYDFEPTDAVAWEDMEKLDRFALVTLADLVERVTRAYDEWRFHLVFHSVHGYCVTELSSFYLDVLKDRLYSEAPNSRARRSAQTVLAELLAALVRILAPVLTFTTEEVWQVMPEPLRDIESVQLAGWPKVEVPSEEAEGLRVRWAVVLSVREEVLAELERMRLAKTLTKSQEASVEIAAGGEVAAALQEVGEKALAEALIVSSVALSVADDAREDIEIRVRVASVPRCPRCWNHRADIGADAAEPGVCSRCADVLSGV